MANWRSSYHRPSDDLNGALSTLADVLDGLDRTQEAADIRRRIAQRR
jgi:hypothetical protein